MKDKIDKLCGKDDKMVYDILLELENDVVLSNELYDYFDDLLNMLSNEKTFIRVRAFRLICSLAKWDNENKINNNVDFILSELEDSVGTSVRQCLNRLKLILINKPELSGIIKKKLKQLDLSVYKENMQLLIQKDVDFLLSFI